MPNFLPAYYYDDKLMNEAEAKEGEEGSLEKETQERKIV